MHRQRGKKQRQTGGEDQLHRDGHRKPEEIARIGRVFVVDQEPDEDQQTKKEVDHVREHADDGQHFGGKEDFLDQIAAGNQRARRLGQRRCKPGPRQNAAEHEQGVRL